MSKTLLMPGRDSPGSLLLTIPISHPIAESGFGGAGVLGKSADELFSRGLGKFYIVGKLVWKELGVTWSVETLVF